MTRLEGPQKPWMSNSFRLKAKMFNEPRLKQTGGMHPLGLEVWMRIALHWVDVFSLSRRMDGWKKEGKSTCQEVYAFKNLRFIQHYWTKRHCLKTLVQMCGFMDQEVQMPIRILASAAFSRVMKTFNEDHEFYANTNLSNSDKTWIRVSSSSRMVG